MIYPVFSSRYVPLGNLRFILSPSFAARFVLPLVYSNGENYTQYKLLGNYPLNTCKGEGIVVVRLPDRHALVRCRAVMLRHFHLAVLSCPDIRLDVDNLFVPFGLCHCHLLSELVARSIWRSLVKLVVMATDWTRRRTTTPISGHTNYTPQNNKVKLYNFFTRSGRIGAWVRSLHDCYNGFGGHSNGQGKSGLLWQCLGGCLW